VKLRRMAAGRPRRYPHLASREGVDDRLPATLPALDGLRGLAIAGVLACHFGNAWPGGAPLDRAVRTATDLGWTGVDLFFVLSGFLITGILVDTAGTPGWWRGFLVRRALRIFPLYYLALVLFGLLGPALGLVDRWTFGRWGGWYWAYLGNWAYAARQGIPALAHFWSLGVEEQFYLLWPLVVLLAGGRRRLGWIAAGLVAASPVVRAWIVHGSGWPVGAAFRVTLGRLDGLATGALLAVLFRTPGVRGALARAWPWAAVLGAAGFLALAAPLGFDMHRAPLEIWSHTLLAVAFGGALAGAVTGTCAGAGPAAVLSRALSARPLRALGRVSYGVYVWHFFIHKWCMTALPSRPAIAALLATRAGYLAYAIAGMAASVGVAGISWRLIERPLLALKDRWAPRVRAPAALDPSA
jgi:peptidoglycan/LPS O-acetylase OafA/YrhL